MLRLNLADVKAAARKAYEAGTLTAQHEDKMQRTCVYANGNYRCAIGASLTGPVLDRVRLMFNTGHGVGVLHTNGVITTDDIKGLKLIQIAHDHWARMSMHHGAEHRDTLTAKDDFLALI